jgi:hypothetical protein
MTSSSRILLFLLIGGIFTLSLPGLVSANASQHREKKLQRLEEKYTKKQNRLTAKFEKRKLRIATRQQNPARNSNSYCRIHHLNHKDCINAWITRNNLNFYGDPQGTTYAGGTPLFNESTGKSINRYHYIRTQHPDAPWRTMQ